MTLPNPSWKVLTITVGLSTFLGGFVAAFSYDNHGVAFPVSAACSLAVLWITARRTRQTFAADARGAFALAVGASAVTVFLVMGVHVFHVRPAWVESTFHWRDHNEPPGWLVLPSLVSMVGLPCAIAFTESLAFDLYRPLRRAVRALLPWLAVALGVLSVVGVIRAVSHAAPRSPIDGLPVIASFQAPSAAGEIERHPLGALTLTVACVQGYDVDCHVLLQSDPTLPLPADWPLNVSRRRYPMRTESSLRGAATLQVLRDQRHDLWIIQTPMLHGRPHPIAAFRGPSLQRVNVGLRDFPGEFAPPLGWPIAALLGVALAGWFARRARYVDAMPKRPLADATMGVDGTLVLADGSAHAAVGSAPAGPVVVAATGTAAPYRDGVPVDVVHVGTIAQWTEALRDERDVRYALAFSTLVLLGTPMAIAAWLRLLW